MTLADLKELFVRAGGCKLYAKTLSKNDNSKQQVYFGSDFQALHLFPHADVIAGNDPKNKTLKAKLDFGWLQTNGSIAVAPGAQFILYPQYPEVRFSGFLKGCEYPPSSQMTARVDGRVLFLGVLGRSVVGFVVDGTSQIAAEFSAVTQSARHGVFVELGLPVAPNAVDSKDVLLRQLGRIHRLGWIDSKQLSESGRIHPCNAPQCGGFTLEAELGIPKNNRAEPDFMGWEVKQHNVSNFERVGSCPITLMTPEPNGGFYGEMGLEAFVRRFGYEDKRKRPDRLNFGGIYRVGEWNSSTKLTLHLQGFDLAKETFDPMGSIILVNENGDVAAGWDFARLITHWTRKHAQAAYVPSMCRKEPKRQYCYGHKVRLATQTDFLRFLRAMAKGSIYYDPGIKVEQASSTKPRLKGRSQFRIKSLNIEDIYETVETEEV